MSDFERLAEGKYLLLTTFRRNGTAVDTPVWVVRDGAALGVWTVADSGKVKRIRRDGTVRVAPCTSRGAPTGPACAGTASVLDAGGSDRIRALVARKYGLAGRLGIWASQLRGGKGRTIGLHVELV